MKGRKLDRQTPVAVVARSHDLYALRVGNEQYVADKRAYRRPAHTLDSIQSNTGKGDAAARRDLISSKHQRRGSWKGQFQSASTQRPLYCFASLTSP